MTGKQLKNSILQLAIQGKLVPQDANDEPASELLKRIRKEKEALVKAKKISLSKPEKAVKPIKSSEYEIPSNWTTCQLVDVCRAFGRIGFRGYTKEDLVAGPQYGAISLSPSNMKEKGMVYDTCTYITWEKYEESPEIKIANGDILIVKTGSSYGKTVLVDNLPHKATINPQIAVIKDIRINAKYLQYFLCSPIARNKYEEFVLGTSIPTFSQLNLLGMELPLPPLEEQTRIVAKIEELMPIVDEYDKAQTELDKLNAGLPERLKKSVLQEAIQGKLGTNNPDDEPASELLKRIRKEKEALVKAKKIKKEKPLPAITDEEKPFDIPDNWEWCRLGDVGIFERGNGIKRDETFDKGLPCVRYGEMYTKYRYAPTFDKTISFTSQKVFDNCRKAKQGDLFMALTGENKQDIALAAQYTGSEEIAVGGDLCHFTILEAYALYFVYLINSPFYTSKKELLATGDIIVHISADKLGSIAIPLPPLAEQRRIVEKLDAILPQIENIK